ncbi:asparagine synthetase B family protein [Saccharicrinis carchari]|nr:hypothetical protein [Saccharicrinis carchari]
MNAKIVGFILSKSKINYLPKINPNIQIKDFDLSMGWLSLYYYGDLNTCMVKNGVYSMGFPASDNLLDHNLLIHICQDEVLVENDWLQSIPLYYNSKEGVVSTFPKVCLGENKAIDKQGLFDYLKYGFSVFERTIFKEVRFLSFYSSLRYKLGDLSITQKEDPAKRIDEFKGASEQDIWNKFDNYCRKREERTVGDIVIPTSGGYDSRIANYFMHDRSRVKNYTYGISANQEKSFEVQQAKKIAKKLGHHWERIHLKDAFHYSGHWHDLYAFSTHLHGMYHIEFYHKINDILQNKPASMISGMGGDVLSGINTYTLSRNPQYLNYLAYTHGINYKADGCKDEFRSEQEFIDRYSYLMEDIRLYPLITMRIKAVLISYVLTVPSMMGLPAWTPFLNYESAMLMLNLPPERRKNRAWVSEFFASKDLLPGQSLFFNDTKNRLNLHLHNNYNFEPLSNDFSMPYLSDKRKQEINDYLGNIGLKSKINYQLTTTRVIKEVLKRFGITNKFSASLSDYQTLKAIEMSLK